MDEALQYESADDESMLHRDITDEEGDVLLRSGIREFLVSSKVLVLASEFSEGCAMRNSAVPLSIKLSDDDPGALAVLLHTIHFSRKRRYLELQLDTQFNIAVLSDKYDCARACTATVNAG